MKTSLAYGCCCFLFVFWCFLVECWYVAFPIDTGFCHVFDYVGGTPTSNKANWRPCWFKLVVDCVEKKRKEKKRKWAGWKCAVGGVNIGNRWSGLSSVVSFFPHLLFCFLFSSLWSKICRDYPPPIRYRSFQDQAPRTCRYCRLSPRSPP